MKLKCDTCKNKIYNNGEAICAIVGMHLIKINSWETEKCMIYEDNGKSLFDKIKEMDIPELARLFVYRVGRKYYSTLNTKESYNTEDEAIDESILKLGAGDK